MDGLGQSRHHAGFWAKSSILIRYRRDPRERPPDCSYCSIRKEAKMLRSRLTVTKTSSYAICPYCRSRLSSSVDLIVCAFCRTAQHRACWNTNGKCSVFGCRGVELHEPDTSAISLDTRERNLLALSSLLPIALMALAGVVLSRYTTIYDHEYLQILFAITVFFIAVLSVVLLWRSAYKCPFCNRRLEPGSALSNEPTACAGCGTRFIHSA